MLLLGGHSNPNTRKGPGRRSAATRPAQRRAPSRRARPSLKFAVGSWTVSKGMSVLRGRRRAARLRQAARPINWNGGGPELASPGWAPRGATGGRTSSRAGPGHRVEVAQLALDKFRTKAPGPRRPALGPR